MAGLTATPVGILSFSSRPTRRRSAGARRAYRLFVAALRVGIDAAGEIAFEVRQHRFRLRRHRARRRTATRSRRPRSVVSPARQETVGRSRAAACSDGARRWPRPVVVRRAAPAPRSVFTLSTRPLATPSDNNARRLRGVERGLHLVDELVGAGTGKKHHEARVRAELSAAHQTARRERPRPPCCRARPARRAESPRD